MAAATSNAKREFDWSVSSRRVFSVEDFFPFFRLAEPASGLMEENRDDTKSDVQESDVQVGGKSLLEGNGFRVVKKIGNGSYSKVKVKFAHYVKTSFLTSNSHLPIKIRFNFAYVMFQLAFSESQKAMVAIKIVSKHHVPDEFLRKFLYNEIKVVKFLKHENIIKYYQSIESSHRF